MYPGHGFPPVRICCSHNQQAPPTLSKGPHLDYDHRKGPDVALEGDGNGVVFC